MAADAQQIIESDDEDFETVEDSPSNGDYVEFGIQSHLGRSPLPKQLRLCLFLCGSICILFSITAIACGITTLALTSSHKSVVKDHLYFEQTGFGMVVLFFAGFESCRKAYSVNFGTGTGLIVFSALSVIISICTAFVQCVNLNFTTDSTEIKLEILVLVYSLGCALVNIGQILIAIKATGPGRLRVSFDNYEMTGNKGTQLCLIGISEILIGVLMGALILSMDAHYFSTSSSFSNENECLGWLVMVAGLSLMLPSLFTTSRNLMYCSLAMQGLTAIATMRAVIIPSNMIYLFWHKDDSTGRSSVALLIMILMVVIGSSYSFVILLTHIFNSDQSVGNQMNELMRRRWPLYSYIPMIQMVLTTAYVLLSVAGLLQKFLDAADLTPFPLLLLFHVVLSYRLRSQPSPYLLLANFGWVAICIVYSLRDVYLFDYHTAEENTPDLYSKVVNATPPSSHGAKIGVHIAIGAVALMELLVGLTASAMYLRTMMDSLLFVFDKTLYRKIVKIVHYSGAFQLLCSILMLNFGFITFLSKSLASELLGDHVIYVGALAVVTALVSAVAGRVYIMIPFAFVLQILNTFFSWQVLDYCCDLLQQIMSPLFYTFPLNMVNLMTEGFLNQEKLITISAISLTLLIIQLIISGINVLLLCDVVENCEFRSKISNIEMADINS